MKMQMDKPIVSQSDQKDEKILSKIATKTAKRKLQNTIENLKNTNDLIEQYSVLFTTDQGYITENLSQDEIVKSVDVSSRTKKMDLTLNFGPYYTDFTKDGRHLLVGGERGELAMMDWKTKNIMFDFNVKERIRAIKYLHKETMMAVSQKDYTFIYDNEGKEMHCIRQIYQATHFEFLPYHYLLVSGTTKGFINYLDTTYGKIVTAIPTHQNAITQMCQNPWNAVICTGHSWGTVSMWTPNDMTPVMKMLCHDTPLRSIAIDSGGNYMATAAQDRKLKIWDLRMTQSELADLRIGDSVSHMKFSQTGLLAVAAGNQIHVLKDVSTGCRTMSISESLTNQIKGQTKSQKKGGIKVRPMLSHTLNGIISDISFCPYEDILAVGVSTGVSTMFVPGSGEPNFDAFEANPYADKKFRNEFEVKGLLNKIPSELININPGMISTVHLPSVAEQWEEDKKKIFGEKKQLVVKKKYDAKAKAAPKRKATTQKDVETKDNLNYERLALQKKMREADNSDYKKKRPFTRKPIDSVLDKLIYKQ